MPEQKYPNFHIMIKPRGPICNLNCKYCYYLSKKNLYPSGKFKMNSEVLRELSIQYIEAQKYPEVVFGWQGGEPTLMGVDFFKKAINHQRKYKARGVKIENAFQTNGTLIDEKWAKFFKKNDFLIGISIDGPKELHDKYRHIGSGKPTFEKVINGLNILKKHEVEFNILACVHAGNANHPLEVYKFFRDELGAQFIQFIPIVERNNKTGFQEGTDVTKRSVTGKQYGKFLTTIFDEWVKQDVGKVYVQIFDESLAKWCGQPSGLCVFSETCGNAMVMEHNGDLYSCDHFVQPDCLLGNILDTPLLELVNSEQQIQFGLNKQETLTEYCKECDVRFACNGGCLKNRVLETPNGESGLNYLCEGYKIYFHHIDPYMQFMRNELMNRRPPANIMEFLKDHEISDYFKQKK